MTSEELQATQLKLQATLNRLFETAQREVG
jgi:hypothetical protein